MQDYMFHIEKSFKSESISQQVIDKFEFINQNMKGAKDEKKGNPLDQIKRIQQKREERRIKMQDMKRQKEEKKAYNLASGKNVDIDFEIMIEKNRFNEKILSPHVFSSENKLTVCVRKRPVFKKEEQNGEIDSVSSANPQIRILQPKFKVDGITKYVQNHAFTFDNTFNEEQNTEDIYKFAIKPLLPLLFSNGVVTCFAYGQTGSGKTFTMNQLQQYMVQQLFESSKGLEVVVGFFEIYAGRCLDLLNEKNVLNIMQDKSNNIQIQGIMERSASSAKELLQIMENANKARTTHSTAANDTSSRSHSICQISVKKSGSDSGKLVLVDLAGSERAQDTQSNNRQRRMEGAEINKSLLALKECIRAMGDKADHVPFRASKLTLILRDSFVSKQNKSKVVMIACISPGSSSADHSLNTLRYADRLKDNSEMHKMLNEIYEKKNENQDVQNQFSKDHLQKIESLKVIKRDQKPAQNKSNGPEKKPLPPPPLPNNSGVNAKKKEEPKKQERKEELKEKKQPNGRSNSTKKTNLPSISRQGQQEKKNPKSLRNNSERQTEEQIDEQIEQEVHAKMDKVDKKKVKEDVNIMKSTLKNQNGGQEYFAFQQKVTNILQQQQEIFATHMAAIKEDAKLLTQQSELISKVQGVGYVDFDVDSYVQKLQTVVKKKLKMYNLLSKKIEHFKKCLNEQEQIRHNVKDTFYF